MLQGKTVGLYFSASWSGPCHRFTRKLVDVFNDVSARAGFEVAFISADRDVESFNKFFSNMPWVAIPFSDSDKRNELRDLFRARELPHLVLLDEHGKVLTGDGVQIIVDHGLEGYPFTLKHVKELKEQDELARRDQSLTSILESQFRNFIISNDGMEVSYTYIPDVLTDYNLQ
mgnify:CR=1 FL=1